MDEAIGWALTVLWFGYWAVISAISLIIGVTIPPIAVLMLARLKEQGIRTNNSRHHRTQGKAGQNSPRTTHPERRI